MPSLFLVIDRSDLKILYSTSSTLLGKIFTVIKSHILLTQKLHAVLEHHLIQQIRTRHTGLRSSLTVFFKEGAPRACNLKQQYIYMSDYGG